VKVLEEQINDYVGYLLKREIELCCEPVGKIKFNS
jgi:hypothetical protein